MYADIRKTFIQGLTAWNRCASSVPRSGGITLRPLRVTSIVLRMQSRASRDDATG